MANIKAMLLSIILASISVRTITGTSSEEVAMMTDDEYDIYDDMFSLKYMNINESITTFNTMELVKESIENIIDENNSASMDKFKELNDPTGIKSEEITTMADAEYDEKFSCKLYLNESKSSDNAMELIKESVQSIIDGNNSAAMYKFKEFNDTTKIKLVIDAAYNTTETKQILNFINELPQGPPQLKAIRDLLFIMKANDDIDNQNVLLVDISIKQTYENRSDPELAEIKAILQEGVSVVMKNWGQLIRNNTADVVVNFFKTGNDSLFQTYMKKLAEEVYDGTDQSANSLIDFAHEIRNNLQSTVVYATLYNEMRSSNLLSLKPMLQIAYGVHCVQNQGNYGHIDEFIKTQLSELWEDLPWHIRAIVVGNKVCIKSTPYYLYVKNHFDQKRDRVMATNDTDEPSISHRWMFEALDNAKTFRIKSEISRSYLYAGADFFAISEERRRLFTWRDGKAVNDGVWEIHDHNWMNNRYMFYNTFHGEYLNVVDSDNSDEMQIVFDRKNAFTYRKNGYGENPIWKIEEDC